MHALQDFLGSSGFVLVDNLSKSPMQGVLTVRNERLAKRKESLKYIRVIEPNSRKAFMQEGKMLSALHHPNIPKVYDIIEHDDFLFIRSEHVAGHSLQAVLAFLQESGQSLARHVVDSLFFQLLQAVYYAHNDVVYEGRKRGIIHCDIKPSNILLSVGDDKRPLNQSFIDEINQGKATPFLVDFGTAAFKGGKQAAGMINYLSPDQVAGKKLNWQTDLYQLSLVFAETLTLTKPFAGKKRSTVLLEKKQPFALGKHASVTKGERLFIERGANRCFVEERLAVRSLRRLKRRQSFRHDVVEYRTPIIIVAVILLVLFLSNPLFQAYDQHFRSTDAILRQLARVAHPSPAQLDDALQRLQTRGFEQKYLAPLVAGAFRDDQGNPLYPSHVDANGEWVLVKADDNAAGAFVGMLFTEAKTHPGLLPVAKEYAAPLVQANFSPQQERRFGYALIPAFEATNDTAYLQQLVVVGDDLLAQMNARPGMVVRLDVYYLDLFLDLYDLTGNKTYLSFVTTFMDGYLQNNVGADGQLYENTYTNATTVYGPIPDDKYNRLVVPIKTYEIGRYVSFNDLGEQQFNNVTASFSRDYIDVLSLLKRLYQLTGDETYAAAFKNVFTYYATLSPFDETDYLFVSPYDKQSAIPHDTLASVHALSLFAATNNEWYYQKLHALLIPDNFNAEKGVDGILTASVYIENNKYEHENVLNKHQSLVMTDYAFLKIKKKS